VLNASYGVSGLALLATGYAFTLEWLDAATQSLCWAAIFLVASAAASSAYLTVSEVFPLGMRAVAIFYAIGTGVGGFLAPALFDVLIETGSRDTMIVGYVIAAIMGVDAERKPLEHVAKPLSAE
jgi:MFS family permease